MLDKYQRPIDNISNASLHAKGIDGLIYAALCNALDAAAPDTQSWTRGAQAFTDSVKHGKPLNKAFFDALDSAAPDRKSWEAGLYAIDRLANGISHLADSVTDNWTKGVITAAQANQPSTSTSSNDPKERFEAQVQATIQSLKAKDKQPVSYADEHGNSIEGWLLELGKDWGQDKKLNYTKSNGGFRETWGQERIILTVNGEFYTHLNYGYDEKYSSQATLEEYRSNTLKQWPESWLVGNKGEPFSEMTAKLKRFAYTG